VLKCIWKLLELNNSVKFYSRGLQIKTEYLSKLPKSIMWLATTTNPFNVNDNSHVEILLSVNKLKHDLTNKYLCEIICKGLHFIHYSTDELTDQDQIRMNFLFPILHPRPVFLYVVPLLQGSHPTCLNMVHQSLVCSPKKAFIIDPFIDSISGMSYT